MVIRILGIAGPAIKEIGTRKINADSKIELYFKKISLLLFMIQK